MKEDSKPVEGENKVDLFQKQTVRKVLYNGEWWFVLNDVVTALTGSKDSASYIRNLRRRDPEIAPLLSDRVQGGGQNVTPLRLSFDTAGGKQKLLCLSIESVLRLVQSVPSKKAEPFKRWLARVGFERLQEIDNPDLAVKRAIALYKAKSYTDEWIDSRISNKASRETLTAEWYKHGVNTKRHMAILTDAVSVESLGVRVRDHRQVKGLVGQGQNLRDHMTPIELTLATLGEQATTEIVRAQNPRSMQHHLKAAKQGGSIAGDARKQIELSTGRSVISPNNFLTERQKANNAKKLAEQFQRDEAARAASAEKPVRLDTSGDFDEAVDSVI